MASNRELSIEQEIRLLKTEVQRLRQAVRKIVETMNIIINEMDPNLLLDVDI
ncbi:MAG: hypothetical protein ACTSYL_10415 [Candidatus Thorarchaeota archaeon]